MRKELDDLADCPSLQYGFSGLPDPPAPADPMTQPLPVAAPDTWRGREDRVRWCRENLTKGERALLVKLSYDVDGVKRADCDYEIAREKKACA